MATLVGGAVSYLFSAAGASVTTAATAGTYAKVGTQVAGAALSVSSASKRKKAAKAAARRQRERLKKQRRKKKKKKKKSFHSVVVIEPPKREIQVSFTSGIQPRRIAYGKTRVAAHEVYAGTTLSQQFLIVVCALCDGPIEKVHGVYLDSDFIPLPTQYENGGNVLGGKYNNKVHVFGYLGTEEQQASQYVIDQIGGGRWTKEHKLSGIAYVVVGMLFDPNLFPNGKPEISALISGRNDIRDPVTGETRYSENAALCLAHYLSLKWHGLNIQEQEINQSFLIEAANVCDERVDTKDGQTVPRYAVSGVVDLGTDPEEIREQFEIAMFGDAVWSGADWKIIPGKFREPVIHFDENDVVGPVKISQRTSRTERVNTVNGLVRSEEQDYNWHDFPTVTSDAATEEDGGDPLSIDVQYSMVSSAEQAQRLARMELRQTRIEAEVEMVVNVRGIHLIPGSTIAVTLERHGWASKVFRVDDMSINVNPDEGASVTLQLSAEDPWIYEHDPNRIQDTLRPTAISEDRIQVAEIQATLPAGEYLQSKFPISVTLVSGTNDAAIRWSKTEVPATSADGTAYSAPITVEEGETIHARAFKTGLIDSDPYVGKYEAARVVAPRIGIREGRVAGGFPAHVGLTCVTYGAEIRWSKGAPPASVSQGAEYDGFISVSPGETIYAVAFKDGLLPSETSQRTFNQ